MEQQPVRKKRFGDILVESQLISATQLQQALDFGKERGLKLGESLLKLGFVNETAIAQTIARQIKIPYIDFDKIIIDAKIVVLLPEMVARKHKAIILGKRPQETLVAFADPLNIFALDEVGQCLKQELIICVAEESKILAAIGRYYKLAPKPAPPQAASRQSAQKPAAGEEVDESVAVTAINDMLLQAAQKEASDIHIEPLDDMVRVRFRIDGILRKALEFPLEMQPNLISRIKILSQLDIGERRKPQDGRFDIPVSGKVFDIRVSTLPLKTGEKVVMRLLDKTRVKIDLEDLGFEPAQRKQFETHLNHPHDIILVTGPTGSGKTTTLYGALNFINSTAKNIVTVEDPLEYELRGINQVQVNPKAQLTFASALRSILRQDPDVIMIGEIRDVETAEIAIQSALTGHLVLSSLHTNDASGAVSRLIEMEIPPFLIASALSLVLAQRLVRRLCPHSKRSFAPPAALQEELGLTYEEARVFFLAAGCDKCEQTGYHGRLAIYEILLITKAIQELIMKKASSREIFRQGLSDGFTPLRQSGIKKVLTGLTSVDEVLRVTLETQK